MTVREETGYEAEDEWRRARAADSTRAGRAVTLAEALGQPAGPVAQVALPCRDCGAQMPLSQWLYDWVKKSGSEIMAKQGERPIEDGEIVRCAPCHLAWHERRRKEREQWDEKVVQLVRETKKGRDLAAHEVAWLRKYGYGDTADGLEQSVRRRAESSEETKGRKRRGDL